MARPSDHSFIGFTARALLAVVGGFALCAAAPEPSSLKKPSFQLSDAGALQQPQSLESQVIAPTKATVQTAMFQPAPMPDPDAARPAGSLSPESPSLMPSLLSEKGEFEGEGYSYSSSQQGALHHRTQPAAGLNLSVPVGQQVGHAPSGD